MRHFRLIIGTTLFLFIVGLLGGSLMLKLTEKIIGKEVVGRTLLSSLMPSLSFGLLLAFCSLCAGGLLWAYSKRHSGYAPKFVFSLGLLVSLITAALGVGSKLLQIRFALHAIGSELKQIPLSSEAINYFSWSFGLILLVNAVIIALLLLVSRLRHEDNTMSVSNN